MGQTLDSKTVTSRSVGTPRLLDQVRYALRQRHYSLRTEETYLHWIRRFIFFSGKRHRATWARPR